LTRHRVREARSAAEDEGPRETSPNKGCQITPNVTPFPQKRVDRAKIGWNHFRIAFDLAAGILDEDFDISL
jgi:hypothetical protein